MSYNNVQWQSAAQCRGTTAMHIQSQMSCQAILSCPTALHADDVGNKYYFDMTQQMVSWGKEDFYTLQYNTTVERYYYLVVVQ